MEIYNEMGYDLLDSRQDISSLEDLERVRALELEDGAVFLRNLALHSVASAEQTLNLVLHTASPSAIPRRLAQRPGLYRGWF